MFNVGMQPHDIQAVSTALTMDQKKSLLIINSCFPIERKGSSLLIKDGFSSYSVGIADPLKTAYDITIISPGNTSSFTHEGIKFINRGGQDRLPQVGKGNLDWAGNLDYWQNVLRHVLSNDFDIIVVHSVITAFLSVVADLLPAWCVGVIHDTYPEKNSFFLDFWRDIWLTYSKRLDLILSDNLYGQQRLIGKYRYDPQKVYCTGSGTDISRFSFSPAKEDRLVFIGRFVDSKNIMELVESFQSLRQVNERAKLVLIGNGVLREKLIDYVTRNHLNKRVEVHCDLNDQQKIAELQRAKIYVSLSQVEGFGISLVEGMACGAVPVVSDIPAHRFVFQGRNVGFLVKDAQDLTAKVTILLKDEAMRREMAGQGRALAEEMWTWQKVGQRYEQAFSRLQKKNLSPFSRNFKKPLKLGMLKFLIYLFCGILIQLRFLRTRNYGKR